MSTENWSTALDIANGTRFSRATIKRELRDCTTKHLALSMAAQHLADPVGEIVTMPVFDLIASGRGCGPAVALRMLNDAKVSPGVRIGRPDTPKLGCLSARQREDLIAALSVGPPPPTPPKRVRAVTPVVAVPVAPPKPVLSPEPDQPGPSLSKWCAKCGEWALPMTNGTCGFCDTRIVAA